MDWDTIEKKYPKGQKLTVTISQVEDFGAFVNLPDGIKGYIPCKELTWTENVIDVREILKIDQQVNTIVLEVNRIYKNLILSVREVLGDPWQCIDKEYKVGDIIEGHVTKVLDKIAYIDIKGKVPGVIYISKVGLSVDRMDEALIVEDRINAKIIKIDYENRVLHLSILDLFIDEDDTKNKSATTIGEIYQDLFDKLKYESEKEINRNIGLNETAKERIKKILVVEPNEEVGCSMAQMLESLGFKATYVLNTNDAIISYKKNGADIILSALNFPDKNGIYLAKTLLRVNPKLSFIFQTAIEDVENFLTQLKQIGLENRVLLKPWNLKELIELINDTTNDVSGRSKLNIRVKDDFDFIDRISRTSDRQTSKRKTIEEILAEITKKINASFAIIFQLHLITLDARIFFSYNWKQEVSEKDRHLLRFSPVKDVIYSNENLRVKQIIGDKYKYLKFLGKYCSIIGERIDFSTEYGFGLFLFGKDENQFSEDDFKEVKNILDILAAALERNYLEEIIKTQHKFLVTGKLSSALIHEIKNEQQPLFNNIEILKTDSVNLNSGEINGNDPKFLARFQRVVNSLIKEQLKIGTINRLFLNLFKEGNNEEIDLREHLNELIQIIQPTADKVKVKIILFENNLLKCVINSSRLDQVMTNILMNAIEQIPLIRKISGKIWINIEYKKDDELPIKIEISDNGPGIHNVHIKRVFNIFFTTKTGGSGLGLFISQALIESMKGRISIKDTIRFKGTTFLLELPNSKKEN